LHVLLFAVGDPVCGGGLAVADPVFGGGLAVREAVPPELLVLDPELHAAAIAMTPAITATAAILAGLAVCDCVIMRTWSPRATLETSPAAGEITVTRICPKCYEPA
jgi:hypothetical protein